MKLTPSKLHLKRKDGVLTGRPFWGVEASIRKVDPLWRSTLWMLEVKVDGESRKNRFFETRKNALIALDRIGYENVTTINIMNPGHGEIPISRKDKGTCVDPGTERYHCM